MQLMVQLAAGINASLPDLLTDDDTLTLAHVEAAAAELHRLAQALLADRGPISVSRSALSSLQGGRPPDCFGDQANGC